MDKKSDSDWQNILKDFLARHASEINELGWGDEDLSEAMKHPLQRRRQYSDADIHAFETQSRVLIPVDLKKFLQEVGSFTMYDFTIFPLDEYPQKTKLFKSWLKEGTLTVVNSGEKYLASEFIPIGGQGADLILFHTGSNRVYFWYHDQWSVIEPAGDLTIWFKKNLNEILKRVKKYW